MQFLLSYFFNRKWLKIIKVFYKYNFLIFIFYIIFSLFLLIISGCDKNWNPIQSLFSQDYQCHFTDSIGVWRHIGLEGEDVTAIAIHPNKFNIIFAGTASDFSAGTVGKLFMSLDCGKTWEKILVGGSYSGVVFDPLKQNIIYAIPHSLLKSTNSGLNWKEIVSGMKIDWETRVSSLVIHPNNSDILYAGTAGFFGGTLYKSEDGGKTWYDIGNSENIYNQNPQNAEQLKNGITAIEIDPNHPDIIYTGTAQFGDVLKSVDGGKSWRMTGLQNKGIINCLLVDPEKSNVIYAGTWKEGFFKSEDGGETWKEFNEGLQDTVSGIKILIDKDTKKLYSLVSSNNSGIYYRYKTGNKWENISISDIKDYHNSTLTISPDTKFLYFGSNNGIYRLRIK